MKKLLGLALLTTSLSSFAQSFVLQTNGVLLSIDSEARVYDLNQFVAPSTLLARGKNWLLDKNQMLTTIDGKGFVYKKNDIKGPKALKAQGGSWFISDKGELSIVTSQGFIFSYGKDDLFKKGEVTLAGGNWLVVKRDNTLSLVTIDVTKGFSFTLTPAMVTGLGLNLADIKERGGNYLVDKNGLLFTIDKNGLVANKSSMGNFSNLKMKGSNFLIDSFGAIRVVLDNGWILLPNLPAILNNLTKAGTTHAWDQDGDFFAFSETAPEAELLSKDPAIFNGVLNKLINMSAEQPDPRTVSY